MSNLLVLGCQSTENQPLPNVTFWEVIVWIPEELFNAAYRSSHEHLLGGLVAISRKESLCIRVSDTHAHLFECRLTLKRSKVSSHEAIIELMGAVFNEHYQMEVKFVGSRELENVSAPQPELTH